METAVDTYVPEVSIATTVLPYPWDDNRAIYLGYRACGYSVVEALQATGVEKHTLTKWRSKALFADAENRLPEIRATLAKEFISIEFFRNFRMVLEKDKNVLRRALLVDELNSRLDNQLASEKITQKDYTERHAYLSKQEQQYLLSLRRQYSPQQFDVLEALISGRDKANGDGFNFAEAVAKLQRGGNQVELSRTDTVRIGSAEES